MLSKQKSAIVITGVSTGVGRAAYLMLYKLFVEGLIQSNREGMPPEQVADAIIKALEVKKLKTRYFLSKGQMYLMVDLMLKKFIPDRSYDAIFIKELNLKNQA